MGDSYREEIKRQNKNRKRGSARVGGDTEAAAARSQAIKRKQSRQALRDRAKEKAVQGRLDADNLD